MGPGLQFTEVEFITQRFEFGPFGPPPLEFVERLGERHITTERGQFTKKECILKVVAQRSTQPSRPPDRDRPIILVRRDLVQTGVLGE